MNDKTEDNRRVVYCWEPDPAEPDDCSTTCMLPDGHDGRHVWSRDDEIYFCFPNEKAKPEGE